MSDIEIKLENTLVLLGIYLYGNGQPTVKTRQSQADINVGNHK